MERLVALCGAAALVCACAPGYDACFDPTALVASSQVLAVRADPPEVIYLSADDTRCCAALSGPVEASVCPDHTKNHCPPITEPACNWAGALKATSP